MQTNNLLAQLKDIYLPEKVSQWWPLAYGWWLLLAIVILVIIVSLVFLHLRKKTKRYKDSIINDFRKTIENTYQQKPREVLQDISVYLKEWLCKSFLMNQLKPCTVINGLNF